MHHLYRGEFTVAQSDPEHLSLDEIIQLLRLNLL